MDGRRGSGRDGDGQSPDLWARDAWDRAGGERMVDAFAGLHLLVLGDVRLERAATGARVADVPETGNGIDGTPIADGRLEVVRVDARQLLPGGAARVAANGAALGAAAHLVAVAGRDAAGDQVRDDLTAQGVAASLYPAWSRRTGTASRVVAGDRTSLYVDEAHEEALAPGQEAWLLSEVTLAWAEASAVVVCDLGDGGITSRLRARLAQLQLRAPRPLTVEAWDLAPYAEVRADVVVPCGREDGCARAPARPVDDGARDELARKALVSTGARLACVRDPAGGVLVLERPDRVHRVPGPRLGPETRGALTAALTLALTVGADVRTAAETAAAAAAVAGTRRRSVCRADDLRRRLAAGAAGPVDTEGPAQPSRREPA